MEPDEPDDSAAHPFADLLGLESSPGRDGTARTSLVVRDTHRNPNGVPHGAVLFALVDTAMGAATMSTVAPGQFCASIEVHLRFLEPPVGERLEASARVVRAGTRVAHLEATLVATPSGRLVATATGTFAVLGQPPPSANR